MISILPPAPTTTFALLIPKINNTNIGIPKTYHKGSYTCPACRDDKKHNMIYYFFMIRAYNYIVSI